jgi:KaiC/GvpD/RAD55 family RecA-like ATPase
LGNEARTRIEPVSAAQVKSRDVDFLYRDLFPRGFTSLIAGNPSKGKSLLSYLIAAEAGASAVLFASFEETREHVWRPRLEAAGANLDRCFTHRSRAPSIS